jgi:hypothetical protein
MLRMDSYCRVQYLDLIYVLHAFTTRHLFTDLYLPPSALGTTIHSTLNAQRTGRDGTRVREWELQADR